MLSAVLSCLQPSQLQALWTNHFVKSGCLLLLLSFPDLFRLICDAVQPLFSCFPVVHWIMSFPSSMTFKAIYRYWRFLIVMPDNRFCNTPAFWKPSYLFSLLSMVQWYCCKCCKCCRDRFCNRIGSRTVRMDLFICFCESSRKLTLSLMWWYPCEENRR